jgi:hypothetical protein
MLSIILAFSSSDEGNRILYLEPALRPHLSHADELSHRPCPDRMSEPYVKFSIRRTQVVQMLWFQNIGLYSAAIFLYVDPRASLTQVATFLTVSFAFSLLLIRALVERDVFYWWRPLWVRLVTIAFVGAWIIVARTAPEAMDIYGYALDPERARSLLDTSSPNYHYFLVGLAVVVIFLLMSFISSTKTPSLRRQILDDLEKNPEGHSYNEWVALLDSKRHKTRRTRLALMLKRAICAGSFEEEVRTQLEKLVYRGAMNVSLGGYGPSAKEVYYRYKTNRPTGP